MLKYAYIDKEKTKMIEIQDAKLGERYYCPLCDAILTPKALTSTLMVPHFAAIPSAHHTCIYDGTEENKKMKKFENADQVTIEDAIEKAMVVEKSKYKPTKKGIKGDMKIDKTSDVYFLYMSLKMLPVDHKIGRRDVSYYLADTRSNYFYSQTRFNGYKIIECKFIKNDHDNKVLVFQYPVYDNLKNVFNFRVKVPYKNNENTFNYIVNGELLVPGNNYVIAAKTSMSQDHIVVYSRKQIVPLPDLTV